MSVKSMTAFIDNNPHLRGLIAEELTDEDVQPLAYSTEE